MNIYDFDNTIYDGDSMGDFLKYSFEKCPFIVLISVIKSIIPGIVLFITKKGKEKLKSNLFWYMNKVKDKENFVNNFCVIHKKNIKRWYLDMQKENDVIISASMDIWLEPFCKMLNIKHLICTKSDENFKVIGKNCKGKEKIVRFKKEFSTINVNNAYSDSLSDIPMFEIAKKGYLVKGNELIKYKGDK